MAKQGNTRDRPNPRHCPSFELVNLTGRRSFGFHQGQRSAYRSGKAGYMTASSTAVSSQFSLATPGASIHDKALRRSQPLGTRLGLERMYHAAHPMNVPMAVTAYQAAEENITTYIMLALIAVTDAILAMGEITRYFSHSCRGGPKSR